MRFSLFAIIPLIMAVAAIPIPDNASSTSANTLSNGINANLDAGNGENNAVQNAESVVKNNGTPAQETAADAGIQSALDNAVGDREKNQATAAANNAGSTVTAGLDKVEAAQGKANTAIGSLSGSSADSATLNGLAATFAKGAATNEANLAANQAENNH